MLGEDMEHWLNMRMGLEPVDQPYLSGSDDEPPFRPSKAPEPASAILAAARAKSKASVVAPSPPGAGVGAGGAATATRASRSIGYSAASHVPSQACRRSLDQRFLAGEATRAQAEADAADNYEDNYDNSFQV